MAAVRIAFRWRILALAAVSGSAALAQPSPTPRQPSPQPAPSPSAAPLCKGGPAKAGAALPDGTTVWVIRHAHKRDNKDNNSPLSACGHAQARLLRDRLKDAGVTFIVTSQALRTKQTAEQLAGAPPPKDVTDAPDADGSIKVAREKLLQGRVLIVGHRNTVPEIISAFGGPRINKIRENDYGDLFTLTGAGGKTECRQDRYWVKPPPPCQ